MPATTKMAIHNGNLKEKRKTTRETLIKFPYVGNLGRRERPEH